MRQNGGYIGYTPVPAGAVAPGVWTLDDVARFRQSGTWPRTAGTLPVAGAAVWFDASNASSVLDSSGNPISVDSTAVATWADLSGNGYNAIQSTSGSRPTWRSSANGINGLSAIAFNGTSQFLQSSYLTIPKTFIVVGINSGTGNREWAGSDSSNGGIYGAWQTKAYSASAFLGFNIANTSAAITEIKQPAITTNELVMHVTQFDGSTLYSGKNNGTFSSVAMSGTPATPSVGMNVGAAFYNRNTVDFLNGKIGELIIYNSVLNATDLTTLYNYLKAKWGTP